MTDFDHHLDARGLKCPEPIMLIRRELRLMQAGEILHVFADDDPSLRDVPDFCAFMGHQLIKSITHDKPYQFWIKKLITI